MKPHDAYHPTARPAPRAQRGVVMVIALIALALLMIGGAALVRSVDGSSTLAGTLGFKRDLSNHADRAVVAARKLMQSGALSADASRNASQLGANYSALTLPTNARGVPNALLMNDTDFAAAGFAAGDIVDADAGISIRYVIDRQCTAAGAFDTSRCTSGMTNPDAGGTDWQRKPGGEGRAVYRVSVRVNGPRDTQAFYQATLVF